MGQLITVDPLTRIEGHLRIDVEVEDGVVKTPGPPVPCSAASRCCSRASTPGMPSR